METCSVILLNLLKQSETFYRFIIFSLKAAQQINKKVDADFKESK